VFVVRLLSRLDASLFCIFHVGMSYFFPSSSLLHRPGIVQKNSAFLKVGLVVFTIM
jgi:hypothetical protein